MKLGTLVIIAILGAIAYFFIGDSQKGSAEKERAELVEKAKQDAEQTAAQAGTEHTAMARTRRPGAWMDKYMRNLLDRHAHHKTASTPIPR